MEINIRQTPKQYQAWQYLTDETTTYLLFGGGAGGGKSWLACEWLLVQCLLYPGSRWFVARNELKRLMNSTFVTWNKVCAFHKVEPATWSLDGKYNVIRFTNGSTIDLLDVAYKPTDPDFQRFGSTEYTGGFLEEAGEIHFAAFDILKSRIGRTNVFEGKELHPKMLLTCNPARNWLYRLFYQPWKNGTLPKEYAFVQSLYADNPHTSSSYERQLNEISNEANRARLKDGLWEYDDSIGVLFKFDHIRDMFTNTVLNNGSKYLIVDVARYGRDKTVINYFEGLKSVKREYYGEQSTETTVNRIKDLERELGIPRSHVLIDEAGVGGGVVDQLPGCKGFVSASQPMPTKQIIKRQYIPTISKSFEGVGVVANFANLRAQCVYKLADLVELHKIAITPANDQDDITDEFAAHKQKDPDKEGKLSIVPKEDVKEIIGRSPDVFDTFVMRMFFELWDEALKPAYNPRAIQTPVIHIRREIQDRGV